MSEPTTHLETEAGQPEKSLEDLLADAETKLQEQKDAWLRALADAENARKPTSRRRINMGSSA